MKFSVVIPTFNHLDDLLRPCIDSMVKNTDLSDAEVIVVANGCTDGTVEYVRSLGDPFSVVDIPRAAGYTCPTNVGMMLARGDYVVLMNNDNRLLDWQGPNEWVDRLIRPFLSDRKVGLTGVNFMWAFDYQFIPFYLAAFPRSVMLEVGLLDMAFSPGYGEDLDYCVRVRQKGYAIEAVANIQYGSYVTDYPVYHKGEGSFQKDERHHVLTKLYSVVSHKYPEFPKGLL